MSSTDQQKLCKDHVSCSATPHRIGSVAQTLWYEGGRLVGHSLALHRHGRIYQTPSASLLLPVIIV